MSIDKAIEKLLESKEFKEAANKDSNLRVAASRLRKDGVRYGKAVDLLLQFGYKIEIKEPKKKPSQKHYK
ncbi:MAG: hypothetical protein V4615_04955 [Bacteroidota bacterium]